MNRILAVIPSIAVPVVGVTVGVLSPEQALRTALLCVFPGLLIFKPPFIQSYFGTGVAPYRNGVVCIRGDLHPSVLFPDLVWHEIGNNITTGGQTMKYVLAILACAGLFILYAVLGAAVFGW